MISEHFRVAVAREYFDRGRKVIGPKMKKCKLGRALESVREDFRVGKHTELSVLRVRLSPRSFSSPCHPRRSVGLLSSSYHTRIPSSCERFSSEKPRGHVHARTCAICLRVQCPLILARYMLAGDSLQRSVGWLYSKISGIAIFPNFGSKTVTSLTYASMRILFIYLQVLFPHFLRFNTLQIL